MPGIVITVLVILLLVGLFAGLPGAGVWHHNYGYYPSGGFGLLVLILILFLIFR